MTQLENGSTPIRGVFSTQEVRRVGTGTTTRKTVQKIFWFVEQEGNELSIQSINMNFIPTGKKSTVTLEDLLSRYAPEPEFYVQSVFPKMQEIKESAERGDDHREKGKNFSAEFEYENVLKLDVENVRANFGIALTYLARQETDKANNIFGRLVTLEAAYEAEHKHLFNEFGISLRKNKMHDQALEYYERALSLTKEDDNLYVNIARVLFDAGNMDRTVENLLIALSINGTHEIATKFLSWLGTNDFISVTMQVHVDAWQSGTVYTNAATSEDTEDTEDTEAVGPTEA